MRRAPPGTGLSIMSLNSMTGFGQGFVRRSGLRVDVEISSVNRKQLDISVNMPRPLQSLEPWIQEQVSHHISRGRVSLQIGVQAADGRGAAEVRINEALARRVAKEMKRISDDLGVRGDISASDLIRIPGVLVIEDAGANLERARPLIEEALARALRAFAAMRRREGQAMVKDLSARLDLLEKFTRHISERAPTLPQRYRVQLRERIKQLAGDLPVSDERLEKEVVMFADRSDVTEELTRLGSHLKQARGMLKQKEPAGRSLDFLAQEMFREINTIASKASDAAIASVVVGFKTELERLREQVQNIE